MFSPAPFIVLNMLATQRASAAAMIRRRNDEDARRNSSTVTIPEPKGRVGGNICIDKGTPEDLGIK